MEEEEEDSGPLAPALKRENGRANPTELTYILVILSDFPWVVRIGRIELRAFGTPVVVEKLSSTIPVCLPSSAHQIHDHSRHEFSAV